jgi:hypothetical protein
MMHRKNVPAPEHNQHSQVLKKLKKWFHLTHQMKLRNDVPVPAHNRHCQVPKTIKKRPQNRHLTHQMTHGLTHDLDPKSACVSLLVAEMAVKTNASWIFYKNSSFRIFPLSTSLTKASQKTVYKMTDPVGMAHSLNLDSFTI